MTLKCKTYNIGNMYKMFKKEGYLNERKVCPIYDG